MRNLLLSLLFLFSLYAVPFACADEALPEIAPVDDPKIPPLDDLTPNSDFQNFLHGAKEVYFSGSYLDYVRKYEPIFFENTQRLRLSCDGSYDTREEAKKVIDDLLLSNVNSLGYSKATLNYCGAILSHFTQVSSDYANHSFYECKLELERARKSYENNINNLYNKCVSDIQTANHDANERIRIKSNQVAEAEMKERLRKGEIIFQQKMQTASKNRSLNPSQYNIGIACSYPISGGAAQLVETWIPLIYNSVAITGMMRSDSGRYCRLSSGKPTLADIKNAKLVSVDGSNAYFVIDKDSVAIGIVGPQAK